MQVNIPEIPNFTRVNIPLDIPDILISNGAVELYAIKLCGWVPTVKDENDNLIPNPVTAIDAVATRIRKWVKDEYESILANQGAEQGRQQAINQFRSFFQQA